MAISAQKREQLAKFLGNLPNAAALKLFAGLEADRAASRRPPDDEGDALIKTVLPHEMLLESLRGQLLAQGAILPRRRADAKRRFFTPFEDFFIGMRRGKKHRARIARSSLDPIWRLMMSEQALVDAAFAAAALDEAIIEKDDSDQGSADIEALERAMFIAAEAGVGRLCDEAMRDAAARDRLIERLGDADILDDLDEIRTLLSGVDFLKQLQKTAPNAAPSLTEEQLYAIRELFLSAHDQSRMLASYVLLALIGRLEKPWRALGVYYHLARSADEQLHIAREAAAVLPETLFEEVESLARALEREGAGVLDAETARLSVSYFADYADGLSKQAKRIGDNVYLNRLEACRDVAGEAFDRFIEQALSAVRAVMPVRQSGGSSHLTSLRPDYERRPSKAERAAATEAALLIARASSLCARLGAEPDFSASVADEARDKLKTYAEDLIIEIRAAEGDERKAARALLDDVLIVAEPLLDSDDIGLIRDRASAASVAV